MTPPAPAKKMRGKHWLFGLLALVFLLLTNIGYINLALHATPEFRYTGANSYAAADKLVYMSMIEQGREGILFMKNLHTTDPQKGLLLSPHWYLVGQTARILGVSNNAAYQAYRIIFTALFVWLVYRFLSLLYGNARQKLLAAATVFFSGGLGWLFLIKHPGFFANGNTPVKYLFTPTDLYVTEGNTLMNFAQSPLFAASQFFLLLSFFLFIKKEGEKNPFIDIMNGILLAALILMHPYDFPIVAVVLGSWSVWHAVRTGSLKIFFRFGIVMSGALAALMYHFYTAAAEPVLSGWLAQNLVYSPPLRNYFWGYGLLLPLSLVGVVTVIRHRRHSAWWMLVIFWAMTTLALLYLPTTLNRRFTNGFHIPLAILAAEGFLWLYGHCRRLWLKLATATVVWAALLGSVVLFLFINLYFSESVYTYGYYYTSSDERRIVDFLRRESSPADALMPSDEKLAFTITSQINRRVLRGHDHQTPHFLLRQQQLDWFFADQGTQTSVDRKREFLENEGIEYVVVHEGRLKTAPTWFSSAPFLREVFASGDLTVYRVAPSG